MGRNQKDWDNLRREWPNKDREISLIYMKYKNMKRRCINPEDRSWERYGKRGIVVCQDWTNNSISFVEWGLTNGFMEGLWLDRIDNNGSYNPENCRWVTQEESNKNIRPRKVPETKRVEWLELRRRGWSYRRIAKRYDVTKGTVRYWCDDKFREKNRIYNKKKIQDRRANSTTTFK